MVNLRVICNFRDTLEVIWVYSGVTLSVPWGHIEGTLGSSWRYFWYYFWDTLLLLLGLGTLGITLLEIKSHFKVLWDHSGGIYGTNLAFLLGNF